jgi:hypothetical protein
MHKCFNSCQLKKHRYSFRIGLQAIVYDKDVSFLAAVSLMSGYPVRMLATLIFIDDGVHL